MTLDYSKWDKLELSDDSDIEVHPNVDKRSFIRAKQNQIHQEREQRKLEIATRKYDRVINTEILKRLRAVRDVMIKRQAEVEAGTVNTIEVALQAVFTTSPDDPKDDKIPPAPAGVQVNSTMPPTYSKLMVGMLQTTEKNIPKEDQESSIDRYRAILDEMKKNVAGVEKDIDNIDKIIDELESQDKKKITSESYHTGFDSSHVNKSSSKEQKAPAKTTEAAPELLNPGFAQKSSEEGDSRPAAEGEGEGDEEGEGVQASPDGLKFANIKIGNYGDSFNFISKHPNIVTEQETDGLLLKAFEAAMEGKHEFSRQCVHQALLLQYCRALGRDGVSLFFKRMSSPGKARDMFTNDVNETYMKMRTRVAELAEQRESEGGGGASGGVEQIQLHAVEPGTTITIRIPSKDATTDEGRKAREIYETFKPDMKKALETGSLDEVNKVLGEMKCEDAEEVVSQLSEAGCLSVEEQIIDATTEEGKMALKEMEEKAKQESEEIAKAEAEAQAQAQAAGQEAAQTDAVAADADALASEAKQGTNKDEKKKEAEEYPDPE